MQHLHSVHVPGTALSMVALFISVADPEGVPWVPWNPSFEGLPSKKIYAKTFYLYTTLTLELCTSTSTVATMHVCQLLHQEFDMRMAYVQVYQEHMATIETKREASN